MTRIITLLLILILPSTIFCSPRQERLVKNTDVEIWTETFGENKNPALLLIMGAGISGIFWSDFFCKKLSEEGFFVIRFDHRDIGKSSLIDYQQSPYTLDDMAQDCLAILNTYKIKKSHIIGLSMGGFIAQILAIKYPERLYSLTSLMSSPDHSVLLAAITGKPTTSYTLPPPPKEALQAWVEMKLSPTNTREEGVRLNLKNWQLCAGVGYDEQEFKDLEERNFDRTKNFESVFNHWSAMDSWLDRTNALQEIKTPSLIIHGDLDIVLPLQHGFATYLAIPASTIVVIPGLGHAMCNHFSNEIANHILLHIKKIRTNHNDN